MDIFDFVTQEEIDALPDNKQDAFTHFVRHASRRLGECYSKVDNNDQGSWQVYEEARYSFKNIVTAAAKKFEIEPFASMEMPTIKDFSSEDFRQFKNDLDHYLTQILLGGDESESVLLSVKAKDSLRQYAHALRKAIEEADMPEPKREALLKKMDQFDKELEKRRMSLLGVTQVTVALFAVPGAMWSSVDVVHKLTTNVLHIVGEARNAEDEIKALYPAQKPKALEAPRPAKPQTFKVAVAELDDEIPF